ncbi:MAG: ATP-binding cassette domain-containing protein, partial [Deltaproteobacteria bacterium]|nr:ATP-binding cassette domain-containing protein [Deltaproteobacteria bacterium]
MEPILEAKGMKALAGGNVVVSGVELRLGPGEVVWVEGASGAGKTTVLRALARLTPWEGELRLQGLRARDVAPHRWRAWVTLVPFPPVALADRVAPDLEAPW